MANDYVVGAAEMRVRTQSIQGNFLTGTVNSALKQAAEIIKADAIRRVPVDSGALRDSIRVVQRRGSPTTAEVSVVAGNANGKDGVIYAAFVEKGTLKTSPHPFLKPAFVADETVAMRIVAQAITDGLHGLFK
jgi:HK97 gp10 family phage protein